MKFKLPTQGDSTSIGGGVVQASSADGTSIFFSELPHNITKADLCSFKVQR